MAFIIALAIGSALAGAAYWSYEVVVVVNRLQTDVCILDDSVRANTAKLNNPYAAPPRGIAGCGTP